MDKVFIMPGKREPVTPRKLDTVCHLKQAFIVIIGGALILYPSGMDLILCSALQFAQCVFAPDGRLFHKVA